jgi:hypothetical protein
MARCVYYKFQFSNGETEFLSPQEAVDYCEKHNCNITYNGHRNARATVHKIRDGFQSGYNYALGEYVGGPRDYAQKIKEKGLIELGHETRITGKLGKETVLDETLKMQLKEMDISDRAIDALDNGTFNESAI